MIHSYRARSKRENVIYEKMNDLINDHTLPKRFHHYRTHGIAQLDYFYEPGYNRGVSWIYVYDMDLIKGRAPLEIDASRTSNQDKLLRLTVDLFESMLKLRLEEIEVTTIFIPVKNKRDHATQTR